MGKPAPWARHSASRVPRQRSQEPSPFGARFVVRSHLPPPACQISYELFLDQVNYISTHMRAVSVCRASTGGGHPLAPRGANLGAVGDTALVPTRSSPPAGPERSQWLPEEISPPSRRRTDNPVRSLGEFPLSLLLFGMTHRGAAKQRMRRIRRSWIRSDDIPHAPTLPSQHARDAVAGVACKHGLRGRHVAAMNGHLARSTVAERD